MARVERVNSDLESGIEEAVKTILNQALRKGDGSDTDPETYPGGTDAWFNKAVGMAMNNLRQWLHDPAEVQKHLALLHQELQRVAEYLRSVK